MAPLALSATSVFTLLFAPTAHSWVRPKPLRSTSRAAATPRFAATWDQIRDLQGLNWTGLIPSEKTGVKILDPALREELVKYGELTQVTYDGFEKRKGYNRFGQADYKPDELLDKTLVGAREGAKKYRLPILEAEKHDKVPGLKNYMYASSKSFDGVFQPIRNLQKGKELTDEMLKANYTRDLNLGLDVITPVDYAWIGYIAVNDTGSGTGNLDIVVAFRGTILPSEWSVNLLGDFFRSRNKPHSSKIANTDVHEGFWSLFSGDVDNTTVGSSPREVMTGRVIELVNHYKSRVKSITCIGHSLGGALATLGAGHLGLIKNNTYHDDIHWKDISIAAYTYAAPRVGNVEFRKLLRELKVPVLNCVNEWDVVPKAPGLEKTILEELANLGFPAAKKLTDDDHTFGKWDYTNSGTKLVFDHTKVKIFREFSKLDVGPKHNLEGLLYMISTQHAEDPEKPPIFRDVAKLNKSDKLLDDLIAKYLGIPACWWQPPNQGLVKLTVKDEKGVEKVIMRPDGGEMKPQANPGYLEYQEKLVKTLRIAEPVKK